MKEQNFNDLVWKIFFTIGSMFLIAGISMCVFIFICTKSISLIFLIFPIFLGMGLIFFSIGGIGILSTKKGRKIETDLKENGDVIYADYVQTVKNTMYTINRRCPYNIYCKWHNYEDGKTYMFKSKDIFVNPERMILERNINKFPVYVDRNNKNKYVVDISDVTKNIEGLS